MLEILGIPVHNPIVGMLLTCPVIIYGRSYLYANVLANRQGFEHNVKKSQKTEQ